MTTAATATHDITIVRTFHAPPESVWKAWTEPGRFIQWWGPGASIGTSAEIDARPGGAWRAAMRAENGEEYPAHGVFEEASPYTRLAMTFAWDSPGAEQTRIAIDFEEIEGGTRMTFTHSGLTSQGSATGHAQAWEDTFDKLAMHVAA